MRFALLALIASCTSEKYEVIGLIETGSQACCIVRSNNYSTALYCNPGILIERATNFVRLGKECEPLIMQGVQ